MIALIDADSLLYKVGFVFEEKVDWNEWERFVGATDATDISITADVVSAKNAIDGMIENILFKTGADDYELWLTGGNNFRYEILPTYKHNRKNVRKPLAFNELWEYLIEKYQANIAEGFEADDMVVMLKTLKPDDYFLCAIDKDVLYQTEGTHFNYGNDEFVEVTKEEALRFFYYQLLVGDTTDGYSGCPSIGKKRATKILDEAYEAYKENPKGNLEAYYWVAVVKAYEAKDIPMEDILVQARVANMHQLEGTSEKLKVNLWKPPVIEVSEGLG